MGRQTLRVLQQITAIDLPDCHSERASRTTEGRTRNHEESLFGKVEGSAFSFPRSAASNAEKAPGLLGGRSFSSDITNALQEGASAPEVLSSQANDHSRFDSSNYSPLATSHFCSRFAAAVESGATPSNHPVVFALAAAANGWEPRETASAFLYSTSAMIVGASLRLLPLGQLRGQRILAHAGSLITVVAETVLDKTEDDMWSFTPEFEIAAMRHESLDGRLFRS
jgi:hypothetical protein